MEEVVNSRVSTDVMSWKRRELAAPDNRAPLLLSLMARSSPASRLMRITRKALHSSRQVTTVHFSAVRLRRLGMQVICLQKQDSRGQPDQRESRHCSAAS